MAKKVKDPADPGPDVSLYLIYIGFAIVGIVWLALHLGNHLSVTKQDVPINPIAIVAGLARGKLEWPRASTVILLLVVLAIVAAVVVRRRMKKNQGKGKLPVDDKAQYMGNGGAIRALTAEGAREKAEQLGVRLGYDDAPGVPIGIAVADGVPLYGSYEDLHLDIWGPRQGKTTSRVIPAILSAVGPVLATSNKRDVVDATRDVREAKGSRTFVFDPQGVAGEPPTWFWDPLAWVDAPREGCEMRASRLAGHFADGDDGSDDTRDTYFDPEAEDLLAGLFLAASVAKYPITQVWEWVTDPNNGEPVEILRNAAVQHGVTAYGLNFTASGLAQQYNAEGRTKSGIFGTAKKMIRCLKLSNVHPWVARGNGDSRYQLDEREFLTGNWTLYCLSLEGRGSAGPLVSALTEAVIERAMYEGSLSRGGRLPIPLLAVLDEAANIVRWKDLPKQYSHFGSRGIVVMTVLQSWAQGARCWGEAGMEALWAAANIKVLGSGVDDIKFLTARSEAIGDYDSISSSVSESKGGKSYSRSLGSSRTLNVNALVTLPRGRAVVFSSGAPATLVRVVPWWEGEYAAEVRRSIEQHDPQRQRTTFTDLVDERSNATDAPTPPDTYGQPEEVRPL
ncbi:type IV secretory system conjugative DNA transfer family protein [Nocardia blacklockiae]|uniref:type IV secretory system conjugative DNA transfer family protein n=1 Tax=Nocardia blacklockiae TaxID=480036 RepID=UPI001895FA73|nr:type IV secretory system conjugative DNA transfer family protein [Nocardia blacklockiae]MBF6170289.1 TraM recognition domain-containing protein [Nocardia blacklockiae]